VRWQYRIHLDDGATVMSIRPEPVFDSLRQFRRRFGEERVVRVEGRWGDRDWVDSALLPTCQEEADALPD
jgi:hypothetical protein